MKTVNYIALESGSLQKIFFQVVTERYEKLLFI